MPKRFARSHVRERAVIDIGSNSVRLVIYRLEGRATAPILNEKVLAGLGRGLSQTGKLNQEGVRRALEALKRYRLLVEAIGVENVHAVATAAIRDASDGSDFVQNVFDHTGFKVKILSGHEEGRLSALGVLAGAPGAGGVAGDLGGSSLELVALGPNGPGLAESWPMGPLALGMIEPFDGASIQLSIERFLRQSEVLKRFKGCAFHAVGGAWRAIAKIDMITRNYPLQVLHNYAMSRAEAITICEFIAGQSRQSLERIDGAIGKRAETLPYAAGLMRSLLDFGAFEQVIISSHGLREGILLEDLSPEERAQDPLVAGAMAMVGQDPRMREFGEALFWWTLPLFEDLPPVFPDQRDEILRASACMLADVGAILHPDDRARIAFEIVLRAPYPAASHSERVFLARASARRYGAKLDEIESKLVSRLLDAERLVRADALGATIRLGAEISGRSARLLTQSTLKFEANKLMLSTQPSFRGLMTEQVVKRLNQLGNILKIPVEIQAN
ncbi:Ppx/GppA family phosphatase [Candidatus Phycosocius spiralis]|uniref:Exopolyphosphatase n=1 Tax=Candidatus Phycosocius spiralis TaxID=2815099 RepID=A0ABQ4PSK9_9PROT|nr:Ppx/GppA family phosphatase [Candidatus Phycosocius spiralis]GIU65995.1 exopolyphosphatase [Candidatus Phycosocius spiralis]